MELNAGRAGVILGAGYPLGRRRASRTTGLGLYPAATSGQIPSPGCNPAPRPPSTPPCVAHQSPNARPPPHTPAPVNSSSAASESERLPSAAAALRVHAEFGWKVSEQASPASVEPLRVQKEIRSFSKIDGRFPWEETARIPARLADGPRLSPTQIGRISPVVRTFYR